LSLTIASYPCKSLKQVLQTRTGFLEEGVKAFFAEHSAQKIFPHCLQWCCEREETYMLNVN